MITSIYIQKPKRYTFVVIYCRDIPFIWFIRIGQEQKTPEQKNNNQEQNTHAFFNNSEI